MIRDEVVKHPAWNNAKFSPSYSLFKELHMASESVRLPDEMSDAPAQLAAVRGRSKSLLMADAIQDFIERESWIEADLQKAVEEADAGKFATEDDMQAVLRKWVMGAS